MAVEDQCLSDFDELQQVDGLFVSAQRETRATLSSSISLILGRIQLLIE